MQNLKAHFFFNMVYYINVKPVLPDTRSKLTIIVLTYNRTVTFVQLQNELFPKKIKSQIWNSNILKASSPSSCFITCARKTWIILL